MQDMQTEVVQRLTRVETKLEDLNSKLDRAIQVNDTAVAALESSKSAHHRLNKIEDNQKWLWRTIAGAFILAAVAFVISGGLR